MSKLPRVPRDELDLERKRKFLLDDVPESIKGTRLQDAFDTLNEDPFAKVIRKITCVTGWLIEGRVEPLPSRGTIAIWSRHPKFGHNLRHI